MAGEYMPLRVCAQLQGQLGTVIPEGEIKEGGSFLYAALDWANSQEAAPGGIAGTLDLDDFLSWAAGPKFCRRSYEGPYAHINKSMLELGRLYQQGGMPFKEVRDDFRQRVVFMAVTACWDRHRQAYRFDSDFVDELMETDTVDIPAGVLARLPFRCFYLDLEQVGRFPEDAGLFVYFGMDRESCLPNIAIIHVPKTAPGHEIESDVTYITGRVMEKAGMFRREGPQACIHYQKGSREGFTKGQSATLDQCMFVLQAMLYLCSNKPDIQEAPMPQRPHKGQAGAKKQAGAPQASVAEVGVRYGAAIRKAKREAKKTAHAPGKQGPGKARKPMASHMRSAHWHRYWVGKGRTEQIVKWVPPVFVSGNGRELPVTIRKVKGD